MVLRIYKKAFAELMKKPFRLWGVTMLAVLFTMLGYALGGPVLLIGFGVAILLQASLANVYLKSYIGGEQIHVTDLFVTFRDWNTIKRVVCAISWGELWKFLWYLIPVVGPIFYIIRSYEYALIPYIVMDQPETGITECKDVSKKMTTGYKGKMFLADILVYIFFSVVYLILVLLAQIPYAGVLFAIILVLFYIAFILLVPLFINIVHASFYEEIKNPPAPVQPAAPQGGQYYAPQQGQQFFAPQQDQQYYAPQGQQYYAPQQDQQYYAPQQDQQYYAPQGQQYYAPQQDQQYYAPQQGQQYYAPQDPNYPPQQ